MSDKPEIILGITGSIAAYKAGDIITRLNRRGVGVHCILTAAGAQFITALTLQTLSGNRVHTDMFEPFSPRVGHIALAQRAAALCIAPATANIIGKIAGGIADDMLSTVAMAFQKPMIIAPAMNTAMYEAVATRENIAKLTARGVCFIEPRESLLACGDYGRGALADVDIIVETIRSKLN